MITNVGMHSQFSIKLMVLLRSQLHQDGKCKCNLLFSQIPSNYSRPAYFQILFSRKKL